MNSGEFGNLEYVLNSHSDILVIVDGKFDRENFSEHEKYNEYMFIPCGGAGNIKNFLVCLKAIPFLKSIAQTKLIIVLFDFDNEGRNAIKSIACGTKNDNLANKINSKNDPFIVYESNIFLAMIVPNESHSWEYSDNYYRHQELKQEGIEGINRQFSMFEKIKIKYDKEKNTNSK